MRKVLIILGLASGAQAPIRENPTGAVDGVNTLFLISKVPVPGSVLVFLNGLLQQQCFRVPCNGDYQMTDVRSIRFLAQSTPQAGSIVTAVYWVP